MIDIKKSRELTEQILLKQYKPATQNTLHAKHDTPVKKCTVLMSSDIHSLKDIKAAFTLFIIKHNGANGSRILSADENGLKAGSWVI